MDQLCAPLSTATLEAVKSVVPPAGGALIAVLRGTDMLPDQVPPRQNLRSVCADVLQSLIQRSVEYFDILKVIFSHALRQSWR